MNKEDYTWEQFDKDAIKISKWARKQNFENIYGVPRGGLPLAVALSHQTNLPLVWDKKNISNKTLIVDDISDTGKTLEKIVGNKKRKIATIYYCEMSKFKPDFYCRLKERWVVFPWETKDSSKYDNTIGES